MVALVESPGLILREGIREGVAPLIEGEADGLVVVRWIFQHRQGRLELSGWDRPHAFGGSGIERYSRGSMSVVEKDLGERTARGVADDDRGRIELADHVL